MGTSKLNSDICGWDASQLNNMDSMFPNAYVFNGNIRMACIWSDRIFTKWQYVTTHDSMESIFSGDISAWDVCNVKNMKSTCIVFFGDGGGKIEARFCGNRCCHTCSRL